MLEQGTRTISGEPWRFAGWASAAQHAKKRAIGKADTETHFWYSKARRMICERWSHVAPANGPGNEAVFLKGRDRKEKALERKEHRLTMSGETTVTVDG